MKSKKQIEFETARLILAGMMTYIPNNINMSNQEYLEHSMIAKKHAETLIDLFDGDLDYTPPKPEIVTSGPLPLIYFFVGLIMMIIALFW